MLIYHKDPRGLTEKQIYELDTNLSILQNIKKVFPKGLNHNITDVYVNGEKINVFVNDLSKLVKSTDEIIIINRQQSFIIAAIVATIAAVAAIVLIPKPKAPNAIGDQKDSSNNKLTGQTNIARLYQAKPDIYGCVRSYPDIVNPSGSEYINNVKYVEHLFCIGTGYYDLKNFKYDQTLLKKIAGTTYKVYEPDDIIPEVRYQFPSAEVNGQELAPPNLVGSNEVIFEKEYNNLIDCQKPFQGKITVILNDSDDVSYLNDIGKPAYFELKVYALVKINQSSGGSIERYAYYSYRAVFTSLVFNENNQAVLTFERLEYRGNSGNYKAKALVSFTNNYLKLWHISGVYTDVLNLPYVGSEIWVDLVFQRGLHGYAEVRFTYWEIDDAGNEVEGTRQYKDWGKGGKKIYTPLNYTIKLKANKRAKYALIIGRTSEGKGDLRDQLKVENVFIVDYDYNYKAKDTLIYVKTRATSQATSLKELKFNVEATRKTITYDTDTKQIDYTLTPSRSFADAVLHQFISVYKRDPSELDLVSLYDIDKRLKTVDERLGYFDYSFDDINISLGQRIETICNAARVYVYRDGQKWRFARNEEKLRPVAMFNALNTVSSSDGGTIQKKSCLPSSYDGVQVEYIDASKDRNGGTDKKEYINLRIKDNKIIEGHAFRPNKIELTGCRNFTQAMNRAQLEIRRLIYERTFIEDEVLNDANFVDKGDLVLWSDTYDEAIVSGEIVKIDNGRFYVDQELRLDNNKTYHVAITDKRGYPSDWINVISHDKNSFTANFNKAYTANNNDIQMGSIFIITETVNSEPMEFLLTEKKYNDGAYKINLVNYDKRIYEYD